MSSWHHYGPSISASHSCSRLQWTNLKPDAIAIMANLFKYMNAAYERLEKETKDALQAESHSPAFADACTEYFGQNFGMAQEPERLKKLLSSLHETNVHVLILRLISGHHIEDCIEADKKDQSELTKSREGLTLALFEDTESQTEQQPAPTPTKGKNYDQNKKRAERKKRQRATIADNGQVEVAKETTEPVKEMVDKSAASAKCHDGQILEDENAAHISQACKKSSFSKYFLVTNSNLATVIEDVDIANSTASTERVDGSDMEGDVAVLPTTFEQSTKMDCIVPADLPKATVFKSSCSIVLGSVEEQIATVALEDVENQNSSYEHEGRLEDTLENEDDHSWTQVVGSRKKSKGNRTGVNPNATNASPVKGSLRFAQHVKPPGGEKLGTALGIAPSQTRRVRVIPRRQRTLFLTRK